jgi:hypothetical protein
MAIMTRAHSSVHLKFKLLAAAYGNASGWPGARGPIMYATVAGYRAEENFQVQRQSRKELDYVVK